jgi:hypothetical protein
LIGANERRGLHSIERKAPKVSVLFGWSVEYNGAIRRRNAIVYCSTPLMACQYPRRRRKKTASTRVQASTNNDRMRQPAVAVRWIEISRVAEREARVVHSSKQNFFNFLVADSSASVLLFKPSASARFAPARVVEQREVYRD